MHQQQTAFENIVGKEEIACNKQFLLFPQCFLLCQKIVSPFSVFMTSYLYLLLKWKNLKLVYEVKGLYFKTARKESISYHARKAINTKPERTEKHCEDDLAAKLFSSLAELK